MSADEASNESLTQKVNRHDEEIKELRGDVLALKRADAKLVSDIAEIKSQLGLTATKSDVALLQAQLTATFTTTINGVLKDALESVPGKFALTLTAICAFVAMAGFLIARWHG